MYQLQKDLFVWWPVTICVPVDGGKVDKHEIDVQFEIIEEEDYNNAAKEGDVALLELLIKDWKGIKSTNNKDLVFNNKNLNAVIKKAFVRKAMVEAYHQAQIGAPVKN